MMRIAFFWKLEDIEEILSGTVPASLFHISVVKKRVGDRRQISNVR